jgi:ssDNA-binding replication factor A large subunit
LKLKEKCVYQFSNGYVKLANKKFTSIKNDYCIVFEKNAVIDEVEDDSSISDSCFDFTSIK